MTDAMLTVPLSRGRTTALLTLLAVAGFCAALPALLPVLQSAASKAGKPLGVLVFAQGAQLAVLCALAAFAGTFWAPKAGFSLSTGHRPLEAALVGTLATAATVAALLAVKPFAPAQLWAHAEHHSFLAGASSAFYGGIVEEILMRWALLSGLMLLFRRNFWAANVASALLFGIGHLPAAMQVAPISAGLLAHLLLGNGVAGLFFGWLYRKRDLEAAMIAHATADVWLHGVMPALV